MLLDATGSEEEVSCDEPDSIARLLIAELLLETTELLDDTCELTVVSLELGVLGAATQADSAKV